MPWVAAVAAPHTHTHTHSHTHTHTQHTRAHTLIHAQRIHAHRLTHTHIHAGSSTTTATSSSRGNSKSKGEGKHQKGGEGDCSISKQAHYIIGFSCGRGWERGMNRGRGGALYTLYSSTPSVTDELPAMCTREGVQYL